MRFGPRRASAGLDPDPRRSVAAAIISREIRYLRAVHPRNLVLLLACAACPGDDKTTTLSGPGDTSGPSSSGATGDLPTTTDGASSSDTASSGGASTGGSSSSASTGGSDETAAMTTAPAGPCDECGPTEICVQEFDGFCGPEQGRCEPANGCVPPAGMSCPPECAVFCANFCGGSICDEGIPGALQCVGL